MGAPIKIALSGFIGNTHDALIVFEACRRGLLPRATGRLSEAERKAIKSGDIFVFNEEESQIKRWTDGKRWSPSRILNNFLIYREIKCDDNQEGGHAAAADSSKIENEDIDELAPVSSTGSTAAVESSTATVSSPHMAPDSTNASRVTDPKLRNITGGLELLPNRKEGGLIKKTISVAGLHMISYYVAEEVIAGRLRQPGSIPELANIDISHPFLMAQFFRHPPQVTFDAEQMPHFAGITDDEPMVRKPATQPRKKKEQSKQGSSGPQEASISTASQIPVQDVSSNPPFLPSLPPPSALSPILPQHAQHLVSSHPVPPHDHVFPSVLSHMSTHISPLLPAVRPGPGSRSSTSLSAASASDTSSPRLRSSVGHTYRHEPYRIPIGRHRYSVTELTPPTPQDQLTSYPYPRQASLPNPSMDYYRPRMQHMSSDTFTTSSPQLPSQYPAAIAAPHGHGNFPHGYSFAGVEHMQQWPSSQQLTGPSDSPRSFYSTTSTLQGGQLATGDPPYAAMQHSLDANSEYTSGHIAQPDYSQAAFYGDSEFSTRPHMDVDAIQRHTARLWYEQAADCQTYRANGAPSHANQSQPHHLIAPQAVQHLAGFLPETGYSPLLPSSAAYGSERTGQELSQMEQSHVKSEPYSPGKHGAYGHPRGAYITAPPPPSYTQPSQVQEDEVKPPQTHIFQPDVKPHNTVEYTTSSVHDSTTEGSRE